MKNGKRVTKSVREPAATPASPTRVAKKTAAVSSLPRAALPSASACAKVRLELYAPQAREVFVAGSFNNWQPSATALQLLESGCWARELTLAPGQYEYMFLVDGRWLPDPKATDYTPNPFGGINSLMKIS
jgi:1,4-alpha-glucan branching enzyme